VVKAKKKLLFSYKFWFPTNSFVAIFEIPGKLSKVIEKDFWNPQEIDITL
jgi:hypothetical protein